jgi:hypothetical protein
VLGIIFLNLLVRFYLNLIFLIDNLGNRQTSDLREMIRQLIQN